MQNDTYTIPPNEPVVQLTEFEIEGRRRKGYLYLVLTFVIQILLILCIFLRGPVPISIAIIGLAVASLVCWIVAAVNLNGIASPRIQRFIAYLLAFFIVTDILTGVFGPVLNARIITVEQKGEKVDWSTSFSLKKYERQTADGQTISIPVQHGKVYVENKTGVPLVASQVHYIAGKMKGQHLNPIPIAPDEVKQIHGRPFFMFRTPPTNYYNHNHGHYSELNGYYGVLSTAR
jgi:hypothetical protein